MTRRMMLARFAVLAVLVFSAAPRVAAQSAVPAVPLPNLEGVSPELQKEIQKLLQSEPLPLPREIGRGWMMKGNDLSSKWGGMRLKNVDMPLQEKLGLPDNEGMLVASIDTGSFAEKAGVKVNDVVVKINSKPVPADLNSFVKLVDEQKSAGAIDLVVLRDGKEETMGRHAAGRRAGGSSRPARSWTRWI